MGKRPWNEDERTDALREYQHRLVLAQLHGRVEYLNVSVETFGHIRRKALAERLIRESLREGLIEPAGGGKYRITAAAEPTPEPIEYMNEGLWAHDCGTKYPLIVWGSLSRGQQFWALQSGVFEFEHRKWLTDIDSRTLFVPGDASSYAFTWDRTIYISNAEMRAKHHAAKRAEYVARGVQQNTAYILAEYAGLSDADAERAAHLIRSPFVERKDGRPWPERAADARKQAEDEITSMQRLIAAIDKAMKLVKKAGGWERLVEQLSVELGKDYDKETP